MSVSSEPIAHTSRAVNNLYHGTWPVEKTMWNSEPTNLGPTATNTNHMVVPTLKNYNQSNKINFRKLLA